MPPVRLEDLILNDMYVAEKLQQQDQYVDTRSTMGMNMNVGSHVQDRLGAMQQQQGLVDNSLDFIPGSKLGDMARRLGSVHNRYAIAQARNEWMSEADSILKNADGSAKTWYIGKPDNNLEEFGISSNPISGKDRYKQPLAAYQKRGHVFATDNPEFTKEKVIYILLI